MLRNLHPSSDSCRHPHFIDSMTMSSDPSYLQSLQVQGNAQGLSQIRTLAFEFRSTLAKFPRAKSELDEVLNGIAVVDYQVLFTRIEQQLTEICALEVFIDSLSDVIKGFPPVRSMVDNLPSLVGLRSTKVVHQNLAALVSAASIENKRLEIEQYEEIRERVESNVRIYQRMLRNVEAGCQQAWVSFCPPDADDAYRERFVTNGRVGKLLCHAGNELNGFELPPYSGSSGSYSLRLDSLVSMVRDADSFICRYFRFIELNDPNFVSQRLIIEGRQEIGAAIYLKLLESIEKDMATIKAHHQVIL
jgi:competence protein ComGF